MHRFSVNYELWNVIYVKLPNSLLWRRLSDKQFQSWALEMQSEFFALALIFQNISRTYQQSILCQEHPLSFFCKSICAVVRSDGMPSGSTAQPCSEHSPIFGLWVSPNLSILVLKSKSRCLTKQALQTQMACKNVRYKLDRSGHQQGFRTRSAWSQSCNLPPALALDGLPTLQGTC